MPKILNCSYCQRYSFTPHLVCTIHPTGPDSGDCLDFAPNAAAAIASDEDELCFPEAARYSGELIPESHSHLTKEEQLELLETHPLFTGRCSQCGLEIHQQKHAPFKWRCDRCGWSEPS